MAGFVNCEIYATKALDIAIIRRCTSHFFQVPAFYLLVWNHFIEIITDNLIILYKG